MELWIRSQNTTRLKKVGNLQMIYNEEDKELPYYINDGYEHLGAYKTKERALKVLDDIQYKIKHMYILENCKLLKGSCIEQRLAMDNFNVYEMPIE